MTILIEDFYDIPIYKGVYAISKNGIIKSLSRRINRFGGFISKERIMSQSITKNGYAMVCLSGKKYYTHQLVAITFLNHIPDGTNKVVVDHIDENKLNNKLDNLRLITNRENVYRNRTNCTSQYKGVNWNKAMGKWRAIIHLGNKSIHLGYFDLEIDASNAYDDKAKKLRNELR